jgi:lipoate-protein ligase A
VGAYQDVEREVRVKYCQEQGVEIGRRLSGGGVVYVDKHTVGWEFIMVRKDSSNNYNNQLVLKVGKGVAAGIRKLGINAVYDESGIITIDGRLLCHIHVMETPTHILCEGYIPMELDIRSLLRNLRIPTEKLNNKTTEAFKSRLASLRGTRGTLLVQTIQEALTEGISKELDICFGPCTAAKALNHITPSQTNIENSVCSQVGGTMQLRSRLRGQDRELTVTLILDELGATIKSASINGDFYVDPSFTIANLEKNLVGLTAKYECVDPMIEICLNAAHITGLTVENFRVTIRNALEKGKLILVGADLHEVSDMYCVGGLMPDELPQLLQSKSFACLLPYCAKQPKCKFRYIDGCGCCGRCDVGEAYKLAEQHGLHPITIQNYEMLEAALHEMKVAGYSLFIGTCCEEFIDKHYQDFIRIGMPGLLIGIDNSTCYELGHELEAHRGIFENQTKLKLDLLYRLIKFAH